MRLRECVDARVRVPETLSALVPDGSGDWLAAAVEVRVGVPVGDCACGGTVLAAVAAGVAGAVLVAVDVRLAAADALADGEDEAVVDDEGQAVTLGDGEVDAVAPVVPTPPVVHGHSRCT